MRAPLATLVLVCAACSSDSEPRPDPVDVCPEGFVESLEAGTHEGFRAGGQDRQLRLEVPGDEHDGPRPLLVMFHGTGESADNFYSRAGGAEFLAAGFAVVAPESAGNGTLWPVWDALREPGDEARSGPDLELFDTMIACVRAHHDIDSRRIFVTGHSAGGIMTNFVLQRRSDVVAGGVPASGVFELTGPASAAELDDMAVLVTWGGVNDEVAGQFGEIELPSFDFYEQAALASQHYEAAPAVEQVWCRGDDVGHAWLDGANELIIDFLLSHPKGEAVDWSLPPLSGDADFSCGAAALSYVPPATVECSASEVDGCQAFCDLIGDCAVENGTVAPILGPQLEELGFSGEDYTECGGCLARCVANAAAGGEADEQVLGCFAEEGPMATCSSGIEGAFPLIEAFDVCCAGATASAICTDACDVVGENQVAAGFFADTCDTLSGGDE